MNHRHQNSLRPARHRLRIMPLLTGWLRTAFILGPLRFLGYLSPVVPSLYPESFKISTQFCLASDLGSFQQTQDGLWDKTRTPVSFSNAANWAGDCPN
jgi:hypothetical protein